MNKLKEGLLITLIKRFVAKFPNRWQYELKRIHYARKISRDIFLSLEPEYKIIEDLIKFGDWVVDIGANVGHYTKLFSDLVGPQGRVLAFEPVPTTFSLLAANVQLFEHANVTLFNTAVSDKMRMVGVSIPKFSTGLRNYYQAHLSPTADSALNVLALSLDQLIWNQRIALVKIDVEGYESMVLSGMQSIITKNHPILIVETCSKKVVDSLSLLGYTQERLDNSPNILFKPK